MALECGKAVGVRVDQQPAAELQKTSSLTPSAASAMNRPCQPEKGAEILEFAFVVSGLMMLLFGIVLFARAYNVYQTITRAAREGARMAVLPSSMNDGNSYVDQKATYTDPNSSQIFLDYIKPSLLASNLNPGNVQNYSEQVHWLDAGDAYQQCGVTISFAYPYTLSIPFTTTGLTTLNLNTSVSMRLENANYQPNPNGDGSLVASCP